MPGCACRWKPSRSCAASRGRGATPPLPVNALKQADEQTVAAVSAVAPRLHRYGLDAAVFRDWGVLAAPYYMGRPAMAAAVQRFQTEGAWGASPHLPPTARSIRRPARSASCSSSADPTSASAAAPAAPRKSWRRRPRCSTPRRVPGVWVVLTAFDPDLPPDRAGALAPGTHCAALALALTPPRPSTGRAFACASSPAAAAPCRRRRASRRPLWTCSASRACWTRWRSDEGSQPRRLHPADGGRRPRGGREDRPRRRASPTRTATATATARPWTPACSLPCPWRRPNGESPEPRSGSPASARPRRWGTPTRSSPTTCWPAGRPWSA